MPLPCRLGTLWGMDIRERASEPCDLLRGAVAHQMMLRHTDAQELATVATLITAH